MNNVKHIHEVLFLFQRTGGYNSIEEMNADIKAMMYGLSHVPVRRSVSTR